MSFLRDPRALKNALIYLFLSAVITAVGFCFGIAQGIFAAAASLIFDITAYVLARRRYKLMAELSLEIDKVLHGQESFDLSRCSEGELSILQSELSKMIVRLREQADSSKKDKLYLADSLADISHQLKTPLTSINLAVSMLSEPCLSEEHRQSLIHDILRSLERIRWLVTSLLKISQLDAGTVSLSTEDVSIRELVRKASEPLLIPMELHSQSFVCDIQEDAAFSGDMAWTAEAVGNIIKNCMEHTPEGGTITVSSAANAIYTEIVISDTGPGFSQDDLPHIFERFYRGTGASEQSIGIGLALSRMIILRQGGVIKAENRFGGGARFIIRFYKSTL
ncbi:MAG: sensor histidine kinase [Oscillospiraceae bacterium]